ncbi:MAG: peptidyl-prolyl cis-trans isomerase, partial [Candidatus Binatia bacterium]
EAPANPTVATVNGATIDADAVRWEMVRRGADFLPRFAKLEEKEAVVEDLVRIEVLAQQARQAGYADDPEIRRSIDRLLAEKYWRDQVEKAPVPPVTVDEARAYYDAHPVEFTAPTKVRGAVIVLRWPSTASESQRAEIRARAQKIAVDAQGAGPTVYASLVETHSQDPVSRRSAGDTGFVVEGTTVYRFEPPVIEALFAIDQIGGVTAVAAERGAYVVRLSAREGGTVAPFDAVAPALTERLTAERKRTLEAQRYAALRQQVAVAIDRQALATVGPGDLAAAARPPSFPVGEKAP